MLPAFTAFADCGGGMVRSASDAEVSQGFKYGEGLSQSGGGAEGEKRAGKCDVDRERPIRKWHSQVAFGKAQSILRWLASTASGQRIMAAQTARKTKAKEDTL
jgi:hypothetical protein